MESIVFGAITVLLAVVLANVSLSQEMVIYPAQGQSQEQLERDKYECYTWAKQQSGFDLMQAGASPQPPASGAPIGGERIRGAARGAAVGAVAGAIAGDAGKGAAAGAAGGTMIGGMHRRDKRRQQAQTQGQADTQRAQKQDPYNRAFGACMEGRGYTVK